MQLGMTEGFLWRPDLQPKLEIYMSNHLYIVIKACRQVQ